MFFFPGNYVQHIKKESPQANVLQPQKVSISSSSSSPTPSSTAASAISSTTVTSTSGTSSNTPDLIDLTTDEFLADLFSTTKNIVPPNVTTSWSYPKRDNANFQVFITTCHPLRYFRIGAFYKVLPQWDIGGPLALQQPARHCPHLGLGRHTTNTGHLA